jgi:hypothetical protein
MYVIRKDVPLPQRRSGRKSMIETKYPFGKMEVGDSFVVKVPASNMKRETTRLRAVASVAQKHFGFKFALRPVETGVGIWRTQ